VTSLAIGRFLAVVFCSILPLALQAQERTIQGRTGLVTVRDGKQKVWITRAWVRLDVQGSDLIVTQEYRLMYPAPPLEKEPVRITVALREDYYRSRAGGGSEVRAAEAKGFRSFAVKVDGRPVIANIDPWRINEKHDTATQWRVWDIPFQPGQQRRMRIATRAPLGIQGGRRYLQFVSKDIGGWRQAPAFLEIRFTAPGNIETRVAGVEPDATDINTRAIRWIYRKASPNRDVYILLPSNYRP
jgi:hypothetical protein